MPRSGLRQVWFLRRSRTPRISPSAVHGPVVWGESSLAASDTVKQLSCDQPSAHTQDKIAFRRHALARRAADERQPSRHLWH